MKTNDTMLLSTFKGNHYLVSPAIPQVLLVHPILKHLIDTMDDDDRLEQLIEKINSGRYPGIAGQPPSTDQLTYYYNYLQYLKKNNYFKKVERIPLQTDRYSAEGVEFVLANTNQIVFEVTTACNLKCLYCGYGELYQLQQRRENQDLSFSTAVTFLDFMLERFNSPLSRKQHKNICISFYGGEPLLNFPFIEKMVRLVKGKQIPSCRFVFNLTTNGILLDKYMDFLAENQFTLLISLDGDRRHNRYRVFKDGRPSFSTVHQNILKLKETYPDYFAKYVHFNSVLTDTGSNKAVTNFIKNQYGKRPQISEVNMLGIKPEKQSEAQQIFKKLFSDITVQDLEEAVEDKDGMFSTPFSGQLVKFIHLFSGFVFKTYEKLLSPKEKVHHVCTGTCGPFEKKVFLTANGNLLPCERISRGYSLGKVDEGGVNLNYSEIADRYNRYFQKMMKLCNRCFNSDKCTVCLFTLDLDAATPNCFYYANKEQNRKSLERTLSTLEESPQYYPVVMRDYQVY